MHNMLDTKSDPEAAFARFKGGLRQVLEVSPKEIRARIASDNSQRTAEREQKGYKKRGPKSKS